MQARIVLGLLLVSYAFAAAPLYGVGAPNSIEGRYIVVFNEDIKEEQRKVHLTNNAQTILHEYDLDAFKGFAAYLDDDALETLIESPDVKFIEADQIMRTAIINHGPIREGEVTADACVEQDGATWGLDRLDARDVQLDSTYTYTDAAGDGVDAYIIDTGVQITHVDFQGRAVWGANFADTTARDCNGHGTHVAGTVGGATYGVAKKVKIIAVKVLACDGSGTNSGVISGVNWAATQAKNSKRPSVANMSLGGGASAALDAAVEAAISGGLTFAIAAGNDNAAACNSSPARVSTGITVGATTVDDDERAQVDERASFSNYGTCVHILAPGQLITSDWISTSSNTKTNTISGTSMAAPHVAGAAALYLSENPSAKPAHVKSHLVGSATSGKIKMLCSTSTGTCSQTPNLMLYVGDLCTN